MKLVRIDNNDVIRDDVQSPSTHPYVLVTFYNKWVVDIDKMRIRGVDESYEDGITTMTVEDYNWVSVEDIQLAAPFIEKAITAAEQFIKGINNG